MNKLILTFLLHFILIITGICQNYWELYVGPNHSNIIHCNYGEQIVYNHTLNSPLWNYGFQVGINREYQINKKFSWTLGLRTQLKGDRKSLKEISPNLELHSLRSLDLMFPLNFYYAVLEDKKFYLKGGLSGNLTFLQNKIGAFPFFPNETFKDKLGVSYQLGFKFLIKGKFYAETMYSEDLTNIYKETALPSINKNPYFLYKNQAFEISLLYKL